MEPKLPSQAAQLLKAIALREYTGDFDCDLCDLSELMLLKAEERLSTETSGAIRKFHGDIRELTLPEEGYDVILAAAVLHHLREEQDWESTFSKIYTLLRPGGSIWITDMVTHENEKVHALMWQRYADYLTGLGGKEYQEKVFAYIDKEDSPRPVTFQLDMFKKVGFQKTEILHKNSCFAAFGAIKGTHKAVVATADKLASSLRSGRLIPAVPHFKRSAK